MSETASPSAVARSRPVAVGLTLWVAVVSFVGWLWFDSFICLASDGPMSDGALWVCSGPSPIGAHGLVLGATALVTILAVWERRYRGNGALGRWWVLGILAAPLVAYAALRVGTILA